MEKHIAILKLAKSKGVDAAVKKYGGSMTASEVGALKALTPSELDQLLVIQTKISKIKASGAGVEASDWTCVNTVC